MPPTERSVGRVQVEAEERPAGERSPVELGRAGLNLVDAHEAVRDVELERVAEARDRGGGECELEARVAVRRRLDGREIHVHAGDAEADRAVVNRVMVGVEAAAQPDPQARARDGEVDRLRARERDRAARPADGLRDEREGAARGEEAAADVEAERAADADRDVAGEREAEAGDRRPSRAASARFRRSPCSP